jgi:O-antigen/teichoic acid export membrane protein
LPVETTIRRLWNSSTAMTWGNFVVRAGSFLIVLPFVLRVFSAAEVVVWYLFSTIIAMQWLLDLGFGPTFSRAVSYAMAGARDVREFRTVNENCGNGSPNWTLLGDVVAGMRRVYGLLAIASLLVIAPLGTWALVKPIAAVSDQPDAWVAWILIAALYPGGLWANVYVNFLEGTNRVALVRRWDMLLGLISIVGSVVALMLGGKLLALACVVQGCAMLRIVRDRALCRWIDDGRFRRLGRERPAAEVIKALWPSTWRSGIGSFFSYGMIYGSSLIVAQITNAAAAASYLVSLKLIDSVAQFSMAPFYSKLPLLARKRAEGDLDGLVAIARRGMTYAYWAFLMGFLLLGLLAPTLLAQLGSNVAFASPGLWALLGLAFFIHRFGGMHAQIYSTTNHITSHIADLVSGLIFMVVSALLVRRIGVYALPLGMLCGYLGFYAWFTAHQSYASIQTTFLAFEKRVVLPPLAAMLAYAVLAATLAR